jgi:hypothetical protein
VTLDSDVRDLEGKYGHGNIVFFDKHLIPEYRSNGVAQYYIIAG